MALTEKLESSLNVPKKVKTKYNASNVKPYEKEVDTAVNVGIISVAITVINTVGCGMDTASGGSR